MAEGLQRTIIINVIVIIHLIIIIVGLINCQEYGLFYHCRIENNVLLVWFIR